jgi:hypothetical protein
LRDFLDGIDCDITYTVKFLSNQLGHAATDRILVLKKSLEKSISQNQTSIEKIRPLFNTCSSNINADAKELVSRSISTIQKKINDRVNEVQGIPGLKKIANRIVDIREIKCPQNLGDIDDENDISFGDVSRTVGSTIGGAATGAAIGSLIPVVGTLLGGIIGGLFGAGSGISSSADEQTQRAKGKAREIVNKYDDIVQKQIKNLSKDFGYALFRNVAPLSRNVTNTLEEISAYHGSVKSAENEIMRIFKRINK